MHKYSIRFLLAVALLVASLAALAWGLLPGERTVLHQTIQPTEMRLPTPIGSLLNNLWVVSMPAQSGPTAMTLPNLLVVPLPGADRFFTTD